MFQCVPPCSFGGIQFFKLFIALMRRFVTLEAFLVNSSLSPVRLLEFNLMHQFSTSTYSSSVYREQCMPRTLSRKYSVELKQNETLFIPSLHCQILVIVFFRSPQTVSDVSQIAFKLNRISR